MLNAERCKSLVFQLDSKGAKARKYFGSRQELSNGYLLFTRKNQCRYSRERALKVRKTISQKLENVRKNIG